jgi:hypothetical protein
VELEGGQGVFGWLIGGPSYSTFQPQTFEEPSILKPKKRKKKKEKKQQQQSHTRTTVKQAQKMCYEQSEGDRE